MHVIDLQSLDMTMYILYIQGNLNLATKCHLTIDYLSVNS